MENQILILESAKTKKTVLDRDYSKHIDNILIAFDDEAENRWIVYNTVIEELNNLGKGDYFLELRYRITDGEDPNLVILDIIEREKGFVTDLIWCLKGRVSEFVEDDYLNTFS